MEFTLNTINVKTKQFDWNSSFNISVNKNKLIKFPDIEATVYNNTYASGQPITNNKVYEFSGINDTTGIYEFVDASGKKTSVPSASLDKIATVNTTPQFYGGFNNSLSYKRFQIDIFVQFTKRLGLNPMITGPLTNPGSFAKNLLSNTLNRWQQPADRGRNFRSLAKAMFLLPDCKFLCRSERLCIYRPFIHKAKEYLNFLRFTPWFY